MSQRASREREPAEREVSRAAAHEKKQLVEQAAEATAQQHAGEIASLKAEHAAASNSTADEHTAAIESAKQAAEATNKGKLPQRSKVA